MTIFDRYIFKEIFTLFAICLVSLTTILFLEKINFMSELILNKGVPAQSILKLLLYICPAFLSITIPMSILLASIMGFSRLSAENEIIAMRSCGLSVYRLMVPAVMLALIGYLLSSVITLTIQHNANSNLKILMVELMQSQADLALKERIFNSTLGDMVVYVDKRDVNSPLLKGVLIYEGTKGGSPKIVTAREGSIIPLAEKKGTVLHLTDGEIHQEGEKKNTYRRLLFEEYNIKIDFDKSDVKDKKSKKGRREMSYDELREEIHRLKKNGGDHNSLEVELHTKLAIPFSCIVFALLGAPLGISVSRSGAGGGFGIGIIIMLFNYIFLIAGQSLGEKGILPPAVSIWVPNAIMFSIALLILRRSAKEMVPFSLAIFVTDIIDRMSKKNQKE